MSSPVGPLAPTGVGQHSTLAPEFTTTDSAAPAAPLTPDVSTSVDPSGVPVPIGPEAVAKGLAFSLGGIVVAVVLAAAFKALDNALPLNSMKITLLLAVVPSALMAFASVALYAKGSGGVVRKGVAPLILVVAAGLAAAVVTALATDGFAAAAKIHPGNVSSQVGWVISYVADPKVWAERTDWLLAYVIAAAAGSFGALYGRLKGKR